MAQRAGTANLPLHGGQVPRWLADRMAHLGAVISEAIVHHYGPDELLRRLAHPFLVPIVRRGHGHGLAFLRDHDKRHRSAEAGADTARAGTRDPYLWRPREGFTANAARADRTPGPPSLSCSTPR